MSRVALAATTQVTAEAGAAVARAGGNAVDAAVAATFMSWVCEPGVTSMAGGAFCGVWHPDEPPAAIDGFVEMPGRSAEPDRFGRGRRVTFPYAGGTDTIIGPESIGTPGALAAVELAWKRWGSRPWADLIAPAIGAAEEGFPFPAFSERYFQYSAEAIYSLTPDSQRLARHDGGTPRRAGETTTAPDLARTLRLVAEQGSDVFYHGELGAAIAAWLTGHGGLLGTDDLAAYRAVSRPGVSARRGRWTLAATPAPSVGGLILIELITLMGDRPAGKWASDDVELFVRAMEVAFGDRERLFVDQDLEASGQRLLGEGLEQRRRALASPSTSHVSAVDEDGLACSITTSSGYGSGVVVPGTGVQLNNVLGEIELAPRGLHACLPGERLRSNVAPCVARSDDGQVLAFGTGGAERIASILAQVWLNLANLDMPLERAIVHPRFHLDRVDGNPVVAHEPGVAVEGLSCPTRPFDELHMYFGGVQAAQRSAGGDLLAVADPRRGGGQVVAGASNMLQ